MILQLTERDNSFKI